MADSASSSKSTSSKPNASSCRKTKKDDATFLEDLKDHIDEFIHASMEEHKICFQKTMKKMFQLSKKIPEQDPHLEKVESVLPLETTTNNF